MNHLAHAVLAEPDEDLILGGVLGDFVHGPVPAGLRPGVARGIRLHRAIDVYTDGHPAIADLRRLFDPPFRRYAGILLDIWFDHLLARDFARWCDTPLATYSDALLALLRRHATELPDDMRGFVAYMQRNGLPAAYADAGMIGRALAGVGTRLSRANPLHQALPLLRERDAALQAGFEAFFPQLQTYVHAWLADRTAQP